MKHKNKLIILITVCVLFLILVGCSVWYNLYIQKNKNVSTFDQCVSVGYPVLKSTPRKCSVPGGKTFTESKAIKGTQVTLEGITTCLPHKNMDGPHTMECALGLKTDTGMYYGISTDPYDTSLSTTNRRVRLTGIIELTIDSIYQTTETMSVSSYEFLD